jgi:hypothetical protein
MGYASVAIFWGTFSCKRVFFHTLVETKFPYETYSIGYSGTGSCGGAVECKDFPSGNHFRQYGPAAEE